MIITVTHNNSEYTIDTSQSVDISIPYNFNGKQPNFYNVEKGKLFPLKTGNDSWSVTDGASCNVPEISMNIHCSGTHTESVGHLLKNTGDIGKLLTQPLLSAILITINSEPYENTHETYHCKVKGNEFVITAESIKNQYEEMKKLNPEALIIRSLPNSTDKQFHQFNEVAPPFFTNEALMYIYELEIKNLIVDLPSVDRMSDNGVLGNHRLFWGDGLNPSGEVNPQSEKTITELAYIPNSIADGFYFLNIQIPHFVCDAAPSRPLLYKPI